MVKFILILVFSYGLLLYSNGENFPFGMNHSIYEKHHSLTRDKKYKEKYKISMDLVAQAGIKWWRAQGAFRWCDVEPVEGTWNFETEDSLLKWAKERGLHLLPVIGYTPIWAQHPKTDPLEDGEKIIYPPDATHWNQYETYIDTLIKRYKKDIKYWQFLNEPYGMRFLGTPEQYAKMYKHTWKVLKSADPDAKIVGLCMTSRNGTFKWKYYDTLDFSINTIKYDTWEVALDSLISLISLNSIDVVAHHIYNTTQNFMKWTRDLKDIVGKDKPIWITETGFLHADEIKAERGLRRKCGSTSFVTYSSDTGEIFWDYVWAKWKETMKNCESIADTFLNIGDTVILIYRTDNYGRDTIIYNGGPLIYRDSIIALEVEDTLIIYDCWADNMESTHNPTGQAANYNELLDSIINTPDFLDNLKIFFYCADNTIHHLYYPPQIGFGNKPNDTTYTPTRYSRQLKHEVYSIIDTTGTPYPAYNILKNRIEEIRNIYIQDIDIDIRSTKN